MGCPCELRFYTDSASHFDHAADQCRREIRRLEHKYSRYLSDSVTSRINRAAGRRSVRIDEETASILKYAAVCYKQSKGLFDITSGVFRQVWQAGRSTLPSQPELDACIEKVGWNKVQLSARTVFLPVKGMALDFGGIVKEYAADAVAVLARRTGIRYGLVNLGGDICLVGPQQDGEPWPLGIAAPFHPDAPIATVSLTEGALATSGGYERYITIKGKRYSHLINPRTGWPVDSLLSVSVAADQAVVAGSVASIALLHSPDRGLDWLERCGAPYLAIDSELECHGHLVAGP